MAILKLFVERAKLDKVNLKDLLFCQDNFELLNQESEIGQYLKCLYKEEFGAEFFTLQNNKSVIKGQMEKSGEIENTKFLFELQTQEGNLDLNMELNARLNLARNVELLVLNNYKHFNKLEKLKKPLQHLVRHSNDTGTTFLFSKYPQLVTELDKDFVRNIFQISVNCSNKKTIDLLLNKFPNLCTNTQLFQGCDPLKVLLPVITYPDKFKDQVVRKYILQAFNYALQESDDYTIQRLMMNHPDICKEVS